MIGRIVCSKAGRDKGKFMVAVEESNGRISVCDGKERPLERPKQKNPKHLAATKTILSKEQILTNKSLHRVLCEYTAKVKFPKEED